MIKQKSRNDKFLRLTVESGGKHSFTEINKGCGGFAYKFQFDNNVTEDDSVYKENENKIIFVCDNLTLNFIKGATVDYESDMMKSAFYVDNIYKYQQSFQLQQIVKQLHAYLTNFFYLKQVQINPNAEKECSCKSSFSPKDSVFNF